MTNLQKRLVKLALIVFLMAILVTTMMVTAQDADADTQAKIESALSAAPLEIGQNATILDWTTDETGAFNVLQEGTNGWTCFADAPPTPHNDPMCLDEVWMKWLTAYLTRSDVEITQPGVAYMYQGGSEQSMTDPYLTEPAEGEDWVYTEPHIMLLYPSDQDLTMFSTDHMSGVPYTMWVGTPFQHLMVPVGEHTHDE